MCSSINSWRITGVNQYFDFPHGIWCKSRCHCIIFTAAGVMHNNPYVHFMGTFQPEPPRFQLLYYFIDFGDIYFQRIFSALMYIIHLSSQSSFASNQFFTFHLNKVMYTLCCFLLLIEIQGAQMNTSLKLKISV